MKFYLFTLSIFLFSAWSYGQDAGSHVFTGALTLKEGQQITVKFVLSNFEGKNFNGYSITDYEGKNYTKSIIKGVLDLDKNTLSFKELDNVETSSTADKSLFCFVSANGLKLDINGDKNTIKGSFKGLFPSGKQCASGSLELSNTGLLSKPENKKEEPPLLKKDSVSYKKKTGIPDTDRVLTSNEQLFVETSSQGVRMTFWDGNVQDNDSIAIFINDSSLNDHMLLTNRKKSIDLPKDLKYYQLRVVAINEGRFGDNTVNFSIDNFDKKKLFVAKLKKGESFLVDFNQE